MSQVSPERKEKDEVTKEKGFRDEESMDEPMISAESDSN